MIRRHLHQSLHRLLDGNPAVVLTGPRQVGKTTLAQEVAKDRTAVYIDLERPSHLAMISDIEEYCDEHSDKLLILDEVHRAPGLFAPLRGIIDERRRSGTRTGMFLLLGSASLDLLKQSSETLAGRVALSELQPFGVREVPAGEFRKLWCRGGFPESFLAQNDEESLDWRDGFVRSYLERDIPQFGPRIPAETLRRFWTMLAHNQGQLHNAAALARGLDITGVSIARYLDLLVDLLLVRRLQPWTSNLGRRLVKAPKVYIRDSGICHALLGIETLDGLFGHPVVAGSWEGFVIENIIAALPRRASWGYYRTSGGAEIDLVVEAAGELWAIEIKRGSAPKVTKGFYSGCEDLRPDRKFVVHGGAADQKDYPVGRGIRALTLPTMVSWLARSSTRVVRSKSGRHDSDNANT